MKLTLNDIGKALKIDVSGFDEFEISTDTRTIKKVIGICR